jgi:hypothetical protein
MTEKQAKELDELTEEARRIKRTDDMLTTVSRSRLNLPKYQKLIAHLTVVRKNNDERLRKLMRKVK